MKLAGFLAVLIVGASTLASAARAEEPSEGHHEFPLHHISLFLGATSETRPHHATERGFAIGAEYEIRLAPRWGVGGLVEGVGQDLVRDVAVLALGSCHFGGGFRVVAGPGVEFGHEHDEPVLRLGAGYEVVFRSGFTVAPELNVDLIGDDRTSVVYGLAFGKEL